jgi:16S rRNA (adenine1518-N6/adenine1519-N6)-dimethyltransferase
LPRKLGQHFLIRRSILARIAAAACPEPEPLVIEIGPGTGALTQHLLVRARRVVAIEVDAAMVSHLLQRFAGEPRLRIVHADILATDLTQWGPAVVAGNLPYYITSPVIERTLAMGGLLRRAVMLIQKEVAARLVAKPNSRDYGFLSVATQMFADVQSLFRVPPSAFQPPPKVDSTVVCLTPHASMPPSDPAPLLAFIGLCFRQKRKTLRNNLGPIFGFDRVDALPEAGRRAEQLSLEEFRTLYRKLAG